MIGQLAIVLFDGFAFGMLLFVLSVGLSVTLGLMNFINLAHGAFGMLGGYIAVDSHAPARACRSSLALPAAFLGAALVSIVFERTLFRRLYRAGELNQVLFTIGLVFVAAAAAAYVFGTGQQPIQLPAFLRGSVEIRRHALRRLPHLPDRRRAADHGLARLRAGAHALRRAGPRRRSTTSASRKGSGSTSTRIFAITFALGSGLAGLGGALAIEIVGLDPSFGFHYLVYVLIVVAVGGLGSIAGSFVGAALLGISDVAGKYFVPEIGSFLIYLLLVAILFVRPLGLFGKR